MTSRAPTHRRRAALRRLPCLLFAIVAAACDGDGASAGQEHVEAGDEYVPLVAYDTAAVRIISGADTFRLRVEVAERDDQRSYGLMERTSLPADAGMIFLYRTQQPADAGFWMYRTRIPLDIAYLDQDGTILSIVAMEPCPDPDPRGCRTYAAGVAYFSALEVNRGYFAERGIGPGDRVLLDR